MSGDGTRFAHRGHPMLKTYEMAKRSLPGCETIRRLL